MTTRLLDAPRSASVSTDACWCCGRKISKSMRRCRHCGVPTIVVVDEVGLGPAYVSCVAAARPLASVLTRPVGSGALLMSALGLLSWCAMLAA